MVMMVILSPVVVIFVGNVSLSTSINFDHPPSWRDWPISPQASTARLFTTRPATATTAPRNLNDGSLAVHVVMCAAAVASFHIRAVETTAVCTHVGVAEHLEPPGERVLAPVDRHDGVHLVRRGAASIGEPVGRNGVDPVVLAHDLGDQVRHEELNEELDEELKGVELGVS